MREMGFEPMVQNEMYFDLANQRFKPLSHHSLIREKRDLNPRLLT